MPEPLTPRLIRIATRGSALALWQAHHVAGLLRSAAPATVVELLEVSTQGDRDRATQLSEMGGQGVFTREVQNAVLDGRADLAVHSLKDLPTDPTPGLSLSGVPDRAPVCDALILPVNSTIEVHADSTGESLLKQLPPSARIGTGSPRRIAQLLHFRSDLQPKENRGNVGTRLRNLDEGQFDAIVLAEAGLRRLGHDDRISGLLCPPVMLPAVGQGALGIECRSDDASVIELLQSISNPQVMATVTAERSLLASLRAGCHAPLGVWSQWNPETSELTLQGVVLSLDGRERFTATATGPATSALEIGIEVATHLRAQGVERLLVKH